MCIFPFKIFFNVKGFPTWIPCSMCLRANMDSESEASLCALKKCGIFTDLYHCKSTCEAYFKHNELAKNMVINQYIRIG